MHVLILPSERFTPPEEPLAGVFQRDQARALRRAGVEVGVVAPLPRSLRLLAGPASARVHLAASGEEEGIHVYREVGWSRLPGRVPYAAAWQYRVNGRRMIRQYVHDVGVPDLVHAHGLLYAGWFAKELNAEYGLPVIVTEHSSVYLTGGPHAWHLPMARAAVDRASALLAVSPTLCRALLKCFGGVRPWEWVPNLLDPIFERARVPGGAPERDADQFAFLNVASMVSGKNHAMLLDAFAERFRGHRGIALRLVGDGPLRKTLERQTLKLGIAEQVTFLGQLSREGVLRQMLSCEAFVLPSDYETFSVVLAEALACGRPVVATRCGGPEDIVGTEEGILVPPGDTTAFGDAMWAMARSTREYDPEELRRRCLSRFGEAAVAGQLLQVYSRVLTEAQAS